MTTTRLRALVDAAGRRLGLAKPAPAPPRAYTDEELIRRTGEFNEAAEQYWRDVARDAAARRHAFNKPLSTVQDTPGMFYRLGLVLDALDLGVGMTVLDFGAGGCWLSSCLNRLRCRTIAMDVSQAALDLGREMFEMDPRHLMDLEPRFIAYDGHRIGLPDASVDRAVMFDAFHHVPNQEEVLAELARVLRPGGRAVFGEPGEGHSHTDQSVFEAETTGVLENDLDIADVETKALTAGFTKVLLKPYPNPSLTLEAGAYRRLIAGETRLFPMDTLREDLRHFYIFVLLKGEPRHDSRNPRGLKAEIVPAASEPLTGRASSHVTFPVTVRNVGDTIWLHEVTPVGGYVMLGGHLFGADGRLVSRGHLRAELPSDVAPGQSAALEARLLLPGQPGRYRLRLDMVDEFVAWFEQVGSKGVDLEVVVEGYLDSREPHQLKASLAASPADTLRAEKPGAPMEVVVRAANVGDTAWLHETADGRGAVALGGHLLSATGEVLDWDYFRTALSHSLDPGGSVDLRCRFAAPPEAGSYQLRLDLLAEQVGWFESWGSPTVLLGLEVGHGVPDSAAPGRLAAQLVLEAPEADARARAGSALTLRVRAENTGNTLWLHEVLEGGGHVQLGAQLWRGAELLDLDYHRVLLPADVPPGGRCELATELPVPAVPGSYRLVLDLVAEGRAWFGSKGSPTLEMRFEVVD